MANKKPFPSADQDVDKTVQLADGAAVDLRTLLGQNLRQARLRSGLSEADVQLQAGLNTATLADIESGGVDLRLKKLAILADILGEDIASLLRPRTP